MLAPICLFTYNRPYLTKQTVATLQQNYISRESKLFIFSDGPKNKTDLPQVNSVRTYLNEITGFQSITIFELSVNKGLANSIIDGVSQIIKQYGKAIVLEDDLVTSPNFLDFMNQALDFYKDFERVHSISGYTLNLKSIKNLDYDNYFGRRASSWGWATWKDRWEKTDWEVKDFTKFRFNLIERLKFNSAGSDMSRMLINQQKGKIDSWAIRWCYSQFLNYQVTVYPKISKIQNIGIGENATHTKSLKRFDTKLDSGDKKKFIFDDELKMIKKLNKEARNKFSIYNRLKGKLKNI